MYAIKPVGTSRTCLLLSLECIIQPCGTDMNLLDLIVILVAIESGHNPTAIGDNGRAVGILQIHPIMVAECNRIKGQEHWKLDDRLDVQASAEMCSLFLSYQRSRYLARHKCEPTMLQLGASWNTGDIFDPIPFAYGRKLMEQGVQ